MDEALVLLHAIVTIAMAGLIWFVQIVHYPLFMAVGESGFTSYADRHARLTTLVVAPLMLTEAATSTWLLLVPPAGVHRSLVVAGAVLLLVVWASTAFLQVPCHHRLSQAFDPRVVQRLVATNWIRTLAWTARAGVAVAIIVETARP